MENEQPTHPQAACDHLVGLERDRDLGLVPVHVSEYLNAFLMVSGKHDLKFNFCPDCGVKLTE